MGGLAGSAAGRCHQGFFIYLLRTRGRPAVYAFHGNVRPFLCMVKGMSMDIIELSIYACLCLLLHMYIILTSLLLALAASISVVLIDLYIIPTACCRLTHTLRLFLGYMCVCTWSCRHPAALACRLVSSPASRVIIYALFFLVRGIGGAADENVSSRFRLTLN